MSKKEYMKEYNKRKHVKEKKKLYMRKKRARKEKESARKLVRIFLDAGYEDLAYKYALERAPEMLVKSKHHPIKEK